VLLSLSLATTNGVAAIRLPRLIGDNMVLQRDAPVKLWGWAQPGERIQIQFRGRKASTRAGRDGRWSATLARQPVGGPGEIVLQGSNTIVLKNVLVGDVWLASGQSNMEFPMLGDGQFGGVTGAEREVAAAQFPTIRLFMVKRATALAPKEDVAAEGWMSVTPQSVRRFSAVAYLFGRELQQRYNVPIGLIESSWGGTPAETWVSKEGLKSFPEFAGPIAVEGHVSSEESADFADYLTARNAWYKRYGSDDRGRADGRDNWASPLTDTISWPTAVEPQPWPRKAVKDFDGTMWFRKEISIAEQEAGKDLRLHLSHMLQADTTYFNGEQVGATAGENPARDYWVPGRNVKRGANLIVVRLTGEYASGDGYVGMLGEPAEMYADVGHAHVALAGAWSYAPGPDLSALPDPPPLTAFNSRFPQAPTLLFNGMIAPLTSYRIKGVIWYQGEGNVGRAIQYRSLFSALIDDWRRKWRHDIPFLFVQLAGYGLEAAEPSESARAELREAQAMALSLPHTGMATTIDIGNETDIHPKNKQDVAHRLALAAAKIVYGQNIVYSGPTYQSMRIERDGIRIRFTHVGTGLRVTGENGHVHGFAIASADGRFVRARAQVEGADVIVSSDALQAPVAVRYNWGNTPDGNLFNNEGLPAVPFRTDAASRVTDAR
jgi:sialate O-acetylesterase